MYSSAGKRLPTIAEYKELLLPVDVDVDHFEVNQNGFISPDPDTYIPVQIDDKHFRLLPGPEFSPRLYRGQDAYYDKCVPSLHRLAEYYEYIVQEIKKWEFYKLLFQHPAARYFDNWIIQNKMFSMNFEGLAQHYEFKTSMLDFSRSKDVAMFFAHCKLNEKLNQYEPIRDENQITVLYTLDFKKAI